MRKIELFSHKVSVVIFISQNIEHAADALSFGLFKLLENIAKLFKMTANIVIAHDLDKRVDTGKQQIAV